jgi:hypothetical protein
MCRRLAAATSDAQTTKILSDMAEEVEADIERLKAEGCGEQPDGA